MTALKKYARLEATGLWRPLPDAQRREVAVSFGDATLVLSETKDNTALSHWSLSAVERQNPGQMPAVYAPVSDVPSETLELDDPAMIEALETVRAALARRRPRKGRLRLAMVAGTLAAIVGLVVFWLPGAVVEHAARSLPFVKRQDVGRTLLTAMERYSGQPCAAPAGLDALDRLTRRLFKGDETRVVVLRDGLPPGGAVHLPGRLILVDRRLIEGHDGPEVLAGLLLAERLRADLADPLRTVLKAAGTRATFTLLATGALPDGALDAQAQARLRDAPDPLDPEALLPRFAEAAVPTTPYALAMDPTGRETLPLIEADPVPAASARPLMPDADWLSLQMVCDR